MNNVIPKGEYCYNIINIDYDTGRIKTKVCPLYKYMDDFEGYCKYMEDYVDDMVKICGENEGCTK